MTNTPTEQPSSSGAVQADVQPIAKVAPAPKAAPALPVSERFRLQTIDAEGLMPMLLQPSPNTRIVNFWATWCGPCIAELPELLRFAKSNPDVDVLLVNVDMVQLKNTRVIPFIEKRGLRDLGHIMLDDKDPAKTLGQIVPGWKDSLPFTMMVEDGEIGWTIPRILQPGELEQRLK